MIVSFFSPLRMECTDYCEVRQVVLVICSENDPKIDPRTLNSCQLVVPAMIHWSAIRRPTPQISQEQ